MSKPSSSAPQILLDLKTVAVRLGVHYSTARDFVVSGKLRGVRLGGRRKIQVRDEDLTAFILASEIGPDLGPIAHNKPRKRAIKRERSKPLEPTPHAWRGRFRAN